MVLDISKMLRMLIERNGSDLHIGVNTNAHIRVDEKIVPLDQHILSADDAEKLIYGLLNPEEIKRLKEVRELDRSFEIEGLSRFRMNVFYQRGFLGCAIRAIPFKILRFAECGLPVKTAWYWLLGLQEAVNPLHYLQSWTGSMMSALATLLRLKTL